MTGAAQMPSAVSARMRAVAQTNTGPERTLRRALRDRGKCGYRLHVRDLPGRPDIVFTRQRLAIFVDGAFWHGHERFYDPARLSSFWNDKVQKTMDRDIRQTRLLTEAGWTVARIWDFEIVGNPAKSADLVVKLLEKTV